MRISDWSSDVCSSDLWIGTHWGQLDILVNNAGINIRKPSNEYLAEEYRLVVETDLIAPFELSRELFPLLEKSGRASVVNIASVAGMMDARTGAPYGMSKSGLIQLTRNLACEWAPRSEEHTSELQSLMR